jgi:hypothetical protein
MPILPLVDLLILLGSFSLSVGFIVKVIDVSTRYDPSILGFGSIDFVVIAGICFGFALTLTARSWLKLNEPKLLAARREAVALEVQMRAAEHDLHTGEDPSETGDPVFGRKTG